MSPGPQTMDGSSDVRVRLPEELAPALRARVDALLDQVPLARRRVRTGRPRSRRRRARDVVAVNRCAFCHRPGKLGRHHDEHNGDLVWAHAKCHRRHHRAHRRTARGDRWWQARMAPLQPAA